MTLFDVNTKLTELAVALPTKIREMQEAELKYNLRFWHLLLSSGMGTIGAKEAEANVICNNEGLLEPVQILRADVRALYHEKDCYLAIAANLRSGQVGEQDTITHDNRL
jgi:hypothetical protein